MPNRFGRCPSSLVDESESVSGRPRWVGRSHRSDLPSEATALAAATNARAGSWGQFGLARRSGDAWQVYLSMPVVFETGNGKVS